MSGNDRKITLRVVLPISGIAHDIKLPQDLRIKDVTPTLVSMLKSLHEDNLLLNDIPLLCRSDTGEALLNPDATLEMCGICDSDTLYLV